MSFRAPIVFIILVVEVLVLIAVFVDIFSYDWNINPRGNKPTHNGILTCFTPWNWSGCATFWHFITFKVGTGIISLFIAAVSLLVSIVITLRLTNSSSVFLTTLLIILGWTTFVTTTLSIITRFNYYPNTFGNCPALFDRIHKVDVFFYNQNWQSFVSVTSVILSFIFSQLALILGYFKKPSATFDVKASMESLPLPHITVKTSDNF